MVSWKDNLLILEPYKTNQNFIWNTFGFKSNYDIESNKAIIKSIFENTSSSDSKLTNKSEILSYNNIPINTESSYCNFISYLSSVDTISLEIKSDSVISQHILTKNPIF